MHQCIHCVIDISIVCRIEKVAWNIFREGWSNLPYRVLQCVWEISREGGLENKHFLQQHIAEPNIRILAPILHYVDSMRKNSWLLFKLKHPVYSRSTQPKLFSEPRNVFFILEKKLRSNVIEIYIIEVTKTAKLTLNIGCEENELVRWVTTAFVYNLVALSFEWFSTHSITVK